jgi:hypothetical protein
MQKLSPRAAAHRSVIEILMQSAEGSNDELTVKAIAFVKGEDDGQDVPETAEENKTVRLAQAVCARMAFVLLREYARDFPDEPLDDPPEPENYMLPMGGG